MSIKEIDEQDHIAPAGKMPGQDHIGGADNMVEPDDSAGSRKVPDEESEPPVGESDVSDATPDDDLDTTEGEEDPETFPRSYVQKLRDENARYRQRAGQADELAHSLHRVLVEQTGRLADASDLEFSEDHLSDPEAMTAAIDGLLESKPHLGSRIARGDIGQGNTSATPDVSLTGILRSNA